MINTIIFFILRNILAIHSGTAVVKFKSLLILSMPIATTVFFNPISEWIDKNIAYIGFVLVAIAIDHILGSAVHAFIKNDFTFRKNIVGLSVKLALALSVGILFEGFQFLYPDKTPMIQVVMDYLLAITRIMVFLYPASSAFVNSSILTDGKFPPLGWIKKIDKFNKSMDIKELNNENEDSNQEN
jgi:hypothetical protein